MFVYNSITFTCRLTEDPILKATNSGKSFCSVSSAIAQQKGQENNPIYIKLQCWNKTAELMCKYCQKGQPLFIAGKLQMQHWVDKATQKKKQAVYVWVESLNFLGENKPAQQTTPPPYQARPNESFLENPQTQRVDMSGYSSPATNPNDDVPF